MEGRNYSRDLRPAEWGSEVRLHGSNPKPPHVRFGSKADMEARPVNVCFTPKSGHQTKVLYAGCSARQNGLHPCAVDVLSGEDDSRPPALEPCALFH
jgi:hypothetical protein